LLLDVSLLMFPRNKNHNYATISAGSLCIQIHTAPIKEQEAIGLIDFLHGGLIIVVVTLKRGQVLDVIIIIHVVIIINR